LDGAAAVILASEERARKITDTPVYIKAVGEYHDSSCCVPTDRCDKSLTTFIAAREAAKEAFKRAKLKPSDIDVAEIYAPFSPQELILPEDLGWFGKGEMIKAIEDGSTEIGGRIPINTDGGLLSRGHPAMVTPFYETINIVRQLRNEAGKLQVDKAETGLMHCEGGTVNNCIVFIFQRGG
jgi:acetyl-CoA C-acetyltransferase